jgi:hypothetical protein
MNHIPYQYIYYIEKHYNNDKNDICFTSSMNILLYRKNGTVKKLITTNINIIKKDSSPKRNYYLSYYLR